MLLPVTPNVPPTVPFPVTLKVVLLLKLPPLIEPVMLTLLRFTMPAPSKLRLSPMGNSLILLPSAVSIISGNLFAIFLSYLLYL